jgi:hypothetical protein
MSGAEGGKFRGKSLVDEFSISEIWARDIPEIGCVFTETGSKPAEADLLTPRAPSRRQAKPCGRDTMMVKPFLRAPQTPG